MTHTAEMTAWDFSSSELPFYDQLYKTGLRMTRSVAETEDLLQETYLKAFRYYSGFCFRAVAAFWMISLRSLGLNGLAMKSKAPFASASRASSIVA